ncbi:UNVERIFIED_CONTAM: hypothetical protein FKN15_034641 [Acipenser sinensis]
MIKSKTPGAGLASPGSAGLASPGSAGLASPGSAGLASPGSAGLASRAVQAWHPRAVQAWHPRVLQAWRLQVVQNRTGADSLEATAGADPREAMAGLEPLAKEVAATVEHVAKEAAAILEPLAFTTLPSAAYAEVGMASSHSWALKMWASPFQVLEMQETTIWAMDTLVPPPLDSGHSACTLLCSGRSGFRLLGSQAGIYSSPFLSGRGQLSTKSPHSSQMRHQLLASRVLR